MEANSSEISPLRSIASLQQVLLLPANEWTRFFTSIWLLPASFIYCDYFLATDQTVVNTNKGQLKQY